MLWITQLMKRITRRVRRAKMAPPEIEHMRLGNGVHPPGIVASGKAHLTSTVEFGPVHSDRRDDMATLKDVIELSINTAPAYEVLQLVDGHVLRVASGQQGRTDLFAIGPESPDLIIGFEVGLLMARLSCTPSMWRRGAFHVVSGPMLERAAKALGYRMESGPAWAEGVWMFCDFFRLTAPESREER